MRQVIEHLEEHYEVLEVPFGRVYKWCPDSAVAECDCGERFIFKISTLTRSIAVCECGADHMVGFQGGYQSHQPEVLGRMLEKDHEAIHHPWRHDTLAQEDQHLRDEDAYPKDSPWRYNDG